MAFCAWVIFLLGTFLFLNKGVNVVVVFCGGIKDLAWGRIGSVSGASDFEGVKTLALAFSLGLFSAGELKEGRSRVLPAPKFERMGGGRKPAVGASGVEASGVGASEAGRFARPASIVRSSSILLGDDDLTGTNDKLFIFSNGSSAAV